MQRSTLRIAVPAACVAVLLAGWSAAVALAGDTDPTSTALAAGVTAEEAMAANAADHDEASDYVWNTADTVSIALTGTGATASGDGVSVSGSVVTISSPGTYQLTGALADGQVQVNTSDDGIVRLILAGVDVTSSTSAPLQITKADKAMVVLADGYQPTA